MSGRARRAASRILLAAAKLLPSHLSPWARAMERELVEIEDGRTAMIFAAGCLRAVLGLAITERLRSIGGARPMPRFANLTIRRHITMNGILARPRLLGLICGAAAVALGVFYMIAAGAPVRYLMVNLVALAIGIMGWLALGRAATSRLDSAGPLILVLAVPLLATAWFGIAVDGASRWISVGPLNLQISLMIVPVMLVLYARRADAIGTAGMIAAAVALAAQPDRAMAGVLAAGLIGLLLGKAGRPAIVAASAAMLAFGWTLLTPDALSAVPYVDRILYTAFDLHPIAGAAVAIGATALLLPALATWRGTSERAALLAFSCCWFGVIAAAMLGNYPTPLVGYGGTAVLGYLLSVALLPRNGVETKALARSESRPAAVRGTDQTTSELRIPRPI